MKRRVVHMIAQSHLDPVWLWRWTEGRAEAVATTRAAVDLLDRYRDLHYTRGEAQVYQWVEREDPELFHQVQTLVREGRWHVVTGMMVQPDMNLPQGESFVRHVLLAKRYFREALSVDVRVGYCVDSFGHAGTLPQILRKCGFDAYVFMRPGPDEKNLPPQAFWWESPDGSRILAFRISGAYATGGLDAAAQIDRALADRPECLEDVMAFFGVGNHGGGPTRAQVEDVLNVAAARDDVEIRFSHPQACIQRVLPCAAVLPVVRDELQYHAVGCYAAHSALKRAHRRAECGLLDAEALDCMCRLLAGRSPAVPAVLDGLWKELLCMQFHDILAGTCAEEAANDSLMALHRVELGSREIADDVGRVMGRQIDTRGSGGSILVLNPFPYRRQEIVTYQPWTDWERWDAHGWGLADDRHGPVPCQAVHSGVAVGSGVRGIERVVFPADLPPMGYRLYRFDRGVPRPDMASGARVLPDGVLENEHLTLRIDPDTGVIRSCRARADGTDCVGPRGWNVAQVLQDTSDTWSHGVDRFGDVFGVFDGARLVPLERGPIEASYLVERRYAGSTWVQEVVLRAGAREILLRNRVCWNGRCLAVKLAFDLPIASPRAVRDVPFGALEFAPDGRETPMQMWADLTGEAEDGELLGLGIANDGKYGVDADGSMLRVTVLRSPPYAHHDPHMIEEEIVYPWLDQGEQRFTLALIPHRGSWQESGIVRRAREINRPPCLITLDVHRGVLPASGSLAHLSSDELELTALKRAADGDGFVLRVADRHGRGGRARVRWMDAEFDVVCGPWEVATLRMRRAEGEWAMQPCSMVETPYPVGS